MSKEANAVKKKYLKSYLQEKSYEETLQEALNYYHARYGVCTQVDNYVIYFEPALGVMELI